MGADRFLATMNPAEMGVGTHGEDKVAIGAAIALEIQAGVKSLEISGGKTVTMELVMTATWTDSWPLPGIIFALRKNILEKDANKIYHSGSRVRGATPACKQGGKFVRTFRPLYFQIQKKDLLRRSR